MLNLFSIFLAICLAPAALAALIAMLYLFWVIGDYLFELGRARYRRATNRRTK